MQRRADHAELPLRHGHEAGQAAQQRGFARTVMAQHGHALAGLHLPVQALQQGAAGGVHAKVFGADHSSLCRRRRLVASTTVTKSTMAISKVAKRPHWNSEMDSDTKRPKPPAPTRPKMVESRKLNSQT